MELTNTSKDSFDPTPKLKSSPIPIDFVPFNQANDCFRCGASYSQTPLFKQKYCKNCLFIYIKSVTDNNTYSMECYWDQIEYLNVRCNKHKPSNDLEPCTRNIQEWRDVCFEFSYFGQIITKDVSGRHYKEYLYGNKIFCKLCERIIYESLLVDDFGICPDCYIISSGWIESIYKKLTPIL